MEKLIKALLFTLFISVFCPLNASANTQQSNEENSYDWTKVINAIIEVESGGNTKARSGSSLGVLQITPPLVAECNRILRNKKSKRRYKLSDRLCHKKSKEMFLLIQSKYNPLNNVEKAIRSWNGGIHFSIKRTQRYFEKVMAAMN